MHNTTILVFEAKSLKVYSTIDMSNFVQINILRSVKKFYADYNTNCLFEWVVGRRSVVSINGIRVLQM